MAKAPAAAKDFDGSGQVWFKILDIGPTFDSSGTATWNLARKSLCIHISIHPIPQTKTYFVTAVCCRFVH